jgi:predicted dehydrogenase
VEDPDINFLINGGHNYLHAKPCLRALGMNKYFFCKKPLAHRLIQAGSIGRLYHGCFR